MLSNAAPLHLDVAALALAPAVLPQPLVLAILVTITHNSDSVVLRDLLYSCINGISWQKRVKKFLDSIISWASIPSI